MNFLDYLKKESTITNTKGGLYYATTFDSNLDLFSNVFRYTNSDVLINTFEKAYKEDRTLALANLLYILDIRDGKGERNLFKTIFKWLCVNEIESALQILPFISQLGRWDYILEGINTPIHNNVINLIKEQLEKDLEAYKRDEEISLLAKWLPSHRTHNKNNPLARIIYTNLGITEREYRKTLKALREKINLIETNLTNREYEKINFEHVPSKAMIKYRKAIDREMYFEYRNYLEAVQTGEKKINTNGLYAYEIIIKLLKDSGELSPDFNALKLGENEKELFNQMWKNQKDFLKDNDENILVMADTSGSMEWPNYLPLANSLGLAIYIAERNKGIFHNAFLTFSSKPKLQILKGETLLEKLGEIEAIVDNTDIDKAFELLLKVAEENNLSSEELPTYIVIISDMEFDSGVYSKNRTNFEGWKETFKEKGYTLPKIVFWNVDAYLGGTPVTKFDKDVALISGFNTSILENLFNIENLTPTNVMLNTLEKYVNLLKK